MTHPDMAPCPVCHIVVPIYGSRPIIRPHLRPAKEQRDDPTGKAICPGSGKVVIP